jgi:Dolichyl-phosphate-mannose-protein mannosyltransferase
MEFVMPRVSRFWTSAYALALAVSLSTWLVAIRSPLWLDETISLYLIRGGWRGIMNSVWPDAPAYSYLLWIWTKVLGTSEIWLRISSILPMLGALALLYWAASKLFERDVALIATILFVLHPIVVFTSIDVRPYAFAGLATNASILALVSLRDNHSPWLAALFGLSAACIVQFHLLFALILPALLLCFLALKSRQGRVFWRQLAVALVAFLLGLVPAIPHFEIVYHSGGSHLFATAPRLVNLISTLTIRGSAIFLIIGFLVAVKTGWVSIATPPGRWTILLCLSLALVPSLMLYAISTATSFHVFLPRYLLAAVPGIALSWALVVSSIDSPKLRLGSALAVVVVMATISFTSARSRTHEQNWKAALAYVESNASVDQAPVLICSGISESDGMVMPTGRAIEDSVVLTPLLYYKLTVPVVALPRSLNVEAKRAGFDFLQRAAPLHERFLAMASEYSYPTLDWLSDQAKGTDDVHLLKIIDGVKILEFVPRAGSHG